MDPLHKFAEPDGNPEAREIKRKGGSFVIVDGELYKRSFSQSLLKCIQPREVDYILREIHEGIYGSHIGARTLNQKALCQGYYWLMIAKDSE